MLNRLRLFARKLKSQLILLYLSYKDPRVPFPAKLFAVCVVAYAFSPIDLIPDFIPILGYLDDLILVPAGIYAALRMIPEQVLEDHKEQAEERMKQGKPRNWVTGVLFILIWIALSVWLAIVLYRRINGT